ncbi:hypothetical protein LJC07_08580 [Christensenellaceae bacterium OttesenSCG-928-L17]|nr:hypothetical protein [Christensenellaceae bacterium OttesenSCG-928-L17]
MYKNEYIVRLRNLEDNSSSDELRIWANSETEAVQIAGYELRQYYVDSVELVPEYIPPVMEDEPIDEEMDLFIDAFDEVDLYISQRFSLHQLGEDLLVRSLYIGAECDDGIGCDGRVPRTSSPELHFFGADKKSQFHRWLAAGKETADGKKTRMPFDVEDVLFMSNFFHVGNTQQVFNALCCSVLRNGHDCVSWSDYNRIFYKSLKRKDDK